MVEVDEPDMHKPLGDLEPPEGDARKRLGLEGFAGRPTSSAGAIGTAQGNWGVTRQSPDMDSRGPSSSSVAGSERSLRHRLRHRLDDDCHASGVAAVGRIAASSGTSNPQIRFGEDLMSRVSYVMMTRRPRSMTKAVREAVNGLIGKVC